MPQIIVSAGDTADLDDGTVTLRERINAADFESERFAVNLIERLGWAVSDAIHLEDHGPERSDQSTEPAKTEDASRELVEA